MQELMELPELVALQVMEELAGLVELVALQVLEEVVIQEILVMVEAEAGEQYLEVADNQLL